MKRIGKHKQLPLFPEEESTGAENNGLAFEHPNVKHRSTKIPFSQCIREQMLSRPFWAKVAKLQSEMMVSKPSKPVKSSKPYWQPNRTASSNDTAAWEVDALDLQRIPKREKAVE